MCHESALKPVSNVSGVTEVDKTDFVSHNVVLKCCKYGDCSLSLSFDPCNRLSLLDTCLLIFVSPIQHRIFISSFRSKFIYAHLYITIITMKRHRLNAVATFVTHSQQKTIYTSITSVNINAKINVLR